MGERTIPRAIHRLRGRHGTDLFEVHRLLMGERTILRAIHRLRGRRGPVLFDMRGLLMKKTTPVTAFGAEQARIKLCCSANADSVSGVETGREALIIDRRMTPVRGRPLMDPRFRQVNCKSAVLAFATFVF